MEFPLFFAIVAGSLLGAGAMVGFAAWRTARGAPAAPAAPAVPALIGAEELARLRAELAGAMADLNAVRAEWKAHQKQLDGYLEAFEDLEDVVERKRRRFAARESKERAAEPEIDPNSRDAARMRARARGFRV